MLRHFLMEFYHLLDQYALTPIIVFAVLVVFFRLLRRGLITITGRLKAREDAASDTKTLADIIVEIPFWFYVALSFFVVWKYFLYELISPSDPTEIIRLNQVNTAVNVIFAIIFVLRAIWVAREILRYALNIFWAKTDALREQNATVINAIVMLANIVFWSIGALVILSAGGLNVTALVASLSVGSVAIAFASKEIIADLFHSFVIYFDQPFKIGDYIVANSQGGTVKKIGLMNTRLTALDGQELIIPNSDLATGTIENYKRMRRRRMTFGFGVVYDTTPAELQKIPALVQKIIEDTENALFSRAHFTTFGDFALNFEVVYFVSSGDKAKALDAQQKINLQLMRELSKMKVEMAFPTQTVLLQKQN